MNIWGPAWKSYIPPSRRVYGCICISATNKVLLVQGKYGEKKWSFPKGHRETYDATPLNCALRELKEETGITLNQSFIGTKRFRAGEYFIYELPSELQPIPEDLQEIQNAGWFTLEELENLNKNVDVSIFTQYIHKTNQDKYPVVQIRECIPTYA